MQFHAAFVTLGNHPLQWVPPGIFALLTGEETAPRFYRAWIERVAFRTHLEDYCVHAVLLQFVELVRKSLLHRLFAHALELSVDSLNPSAAELAFLLSVNIDSTHNDECYQ